MSCLRGLDFSSILDLFLYDVTAFPFFRNKKLENQDKKGKRLDTSSYGSKKNIDLKRCIFYHFTFRFMKNIFIYQKIF